MPISVPPIPQLNYQRVQFDPSQLSGLGDDLLQALDRRRKNKNDREAGDILGRWADETYSDNPSAIAGGIQGAGQPGQLAYGSRPLGRGTTDPVNARVDQAFSAAGESAPGGYAARLLGLADAPAQYRSAYADAGQRYGVDPSLLVRQGKQESGFDPNAVSSAGARGISQFMPATAAEMGVDPADPRSSIDGQGRYMGQLENQFGENSGFAAASYNWGPNRVRSWLAAGADPSKMPRETRDYVQSVTGKPIESWLRGDGNAGQDQSGADQPHQGMTINGTRLPSRDVMMAMLRNPETRPLAAQILSAAHKDRTSELPAAAQEFLFAVQNGFTGDFQDWIATKAQSSRTGGPSAYRMRDDGTQEYVPGGPADPETIRRQAEARTGGHQPRPLAQTAINAIGAAGSSFADLDRVYTGFDDKFGGFVSQTAGDMANWAGRHLPGASGDRVAAAEWWQDYQRQKNVARHDLFGSALTRSELPEFEAADINPGMTPETIKKNLERQRMIAQRAAKKLAGVYVAQGYRPEVIESAIGFPLSELGITVPSDSASLGADAGDGAQPVEIDGKTYYVSPDGQVYE